MNVFLTSKSSVDMRVNHGHSDRQFSIHQPLFAEEAGDEATGDPSCLAVVPVTLSDANEVVQAKPDKPLHRYAEKRLIRK